MIDNTPVITNLEDLLLEKKRLKLRIKQNKAAVRTGFSEIKDELNPFSGVSEKLRSVFSQVQVSPLVKYGVTGAANFLLKKLVFNRVGWVPRLLLPLAVNKVSDALLAPKINKTLAETLHHTADTIRTAEDYNIIDDERQTLREYPKSKVRRNIAMKLRKIANAIRS